MFSILKLLSAKVCDMKHQAVPPIFLSCCESVRTHKYTHNSHCPWYMYNSLMKSYKVRVLLTLQRFSAQAVSSTRAQRRAANQLSIAPMASLTHTLTHITTQFIHTFARSPLSQYYMPLASLCNLLPLSLCLSSMITNCAC